MKTKTSAFRLVGVLAMGAAVTTGCAADSESEDRADGPTISVGDRDKADATGLEVLGHLEPSQAKETVLSPSLNRHGYLFWGHNGASLDLEVTQRGSAAGLDTVMRIYGPRAADGTYPSQVAEDDDAGYGKLSRIKALTLRQDGHYLVEIEHKGGAPTTDRKYRVELRGTSGTWEPFKAVGDQDRATRWVDVSAEYQGLSRQAYRAASERLDELVLSGGLPATWAVSLDIDETVLMNVTYERERKLLGLGYTPVTWKLWVDRRDATPVPGAKDFLNKVRVAGGHVVFVTNRKDATECAQTRDNLAAQSIMYDSILCRTTTSDKNERFEMIESGTGTGLPPMPVVMFVGDNIQDFPNLTQDVRIEGAAGYVEFGESFFLLPNPMYGSWEKN